MSPGARIRVRAATPDDLPAVVALARRSLGWHDDDVRYLAWKHIENPVGPSRMLLALADERVVGFRAFLPWEFGGPDGSIVRAARAVDTATDPEYQGQGIFTRLTLAALDLLTAEGVTLIFNTPNSQSLPGYLKMGWQTMGRVPIAVRPAGWRFAVAALGGRRSAERWPVATSAGEAAPAVLSDTPAVERLLAAVRPPTGLATRRSAAFLRWRYGLSELGYRVMVAHGGIESGLAVFRLRRRGRATEAVLCDILVPGADRATARRLVGAIARRSGADYVLRIHAAWIASGRFVRVPRSGPILTCRPLDGAAPPTLRDLSLTMGDIELL